MRKNSQISSMVKLSLKSSVCKCRDYRVLSLLCSQIHYDLGSIVFRKHMLCFGHIGSHRSTWWSWVHCFSQTHVVFRAHWESQINLYLGYFSSLTHLKNYTRSLGFQPRFVSSHALYALFFSQTHVEFRVHWLSQVNLYLGFFSSLQHLKVTSFSRFSVEVREKPCFVRKAGTLVQGFCLMKLPPQNYALYTTDFQADWLAWKVMSRRRESSLFGFDLRCESQL